MKSEIESYEPCRLSNSGPSSRRDSMLVGDQTREPWARPCQDPVDRPRRPLRNAPVAVTGASLLLRTSHDCLPLGCSGYQRASMTENEGAPRASPMRAEWAAIGKPMRGQPWEPPNALSIPAEKHRYANAMRGTWIPGSCHEELNACPRERHRRFARALLLRYTATGSASRFRTIEPVKLNLSSLDSTFRYDP